MYHHPNTIKLIQLNGVAIKVGWNSINPRLCFCQEVARRSGEMGNEYPSDEAIEIAEEMIRELEKQVKWMKEEFMSDV